MGTVRKVKSAIQVRVDERVKKKAEIALREMGLSMSEIVRILLVRVGEEKAIPFEIRVPNATTVRAIEAGRRGEVAKFNTVADLMADLNARDSADPPVQTRSQAHQSDAALQRHRRTTSGHCYAPGM